MYECAMRVATEMVNLAGLKQQLRCYLATLNALKLVNSQYAWIVKPVLKIEDPALVAASPKHSHDGDLIPVTKVKSRLEVLEISDIERELQLVAARLKLATCSTAQRKRDQGGLVTGPGLSASDAVTLLVASNLFTEAAKLCKIFSLEYRPIVEGLASRCIYLSRSKSAERDAAWDWLAENNCGENGGGAQTSVESAWSLLKKTVQDLELKGQTTLHKAVAIRLLTHGTSLPAWLITSFKKTNAAELLHLYLSHGYVLLASVLAVEFIEAALGNGKEYYGLTDALHATAPPIWLPFNLFDQLLLELKDHAGNGQDPLYQKHYLRLNSSLDHYMQVVKQVSQDKLRIGG